MASLSFRKTLGRKLLATGVTLTVASGLAAAALLTGVGSGASASTAPVSSATSASPTAGTDTKGVDPGVARFRADLKEARALTGQARIDAVKKIRQDAKAGKYGDKVQKRVTNKGKRFAAIWAHAPADLKADLEDVRKADPSDRAALKHEIFTKALAGDYGDMAQKRAEKMKELVDGK